MQLRWRGEGPGGWMKEPDPHRCSWFRLPLWRGSAALCCSLCPASSPRMDRALTRHPLPARPLPECLLACLALAETLWLGELLGPWAAGPPVFRWLLGPALPPAPWPLSCFCLCQLLELAPDPCPHWGLPCCVAYSPRQPSRQEAVLSGGSYSLGTSLHTPSSPNPFA